MGDKSRLSHININAQKVVSNIAKIIINKENAIIVKNQDIGNVIIEY